MQNYSANFNTTFNPNFGKWKIVKPAVHLLGQPLNPTEATGATWENAWMFHVILYSCCFSVYSVYSVTGVIRSHDRKDKVTRILAYIIHGLIFFLGLSRLFTLSVFYNEIKEATVTERQSVLARVVFGVGFPCITAAFALVQFSFTEALKGKLSESKLGNFKFLIFIISLHFLVVLTVEVLTSLLRNLALLFFATKFYFLFMTAISMIRILYSGCKVLSQASENKRALHNLSIHYGSTPKEEHTRKKSVAEDDMAKSLRKVKVIITMTCVFCSIICIMEISSICELAEILAGKDGALAPWPWYAYQTFFRLAEVGMAGTILYTLVPPRQPKTKMSFDKRATIWQRIFGSKQASNKIGDVVAGDDGHPVAMLNQAYNIGNEN